MQGLPSPCGEHPMHCYLFERGYDLRGPDDKSLMHVGWGGHEVHTERIVMELLVYQASRTLGHVQWRPPWFGHAVTWFGPTCLT